MSNRAIVDKEVTQGAVPVGIPKAYNGVALLETAKKIIGEDLDIATNGLASKVVHNTVYKLNAPIDGLGAVDNGVDGEFLRTKGNGRTEWTEIGIPSDTQVHDILLAWLDAHPEVAAQIGNASYQGQQEIVTALNGISLGLLPHNVFVFDSVAEMILSAELLPSTTAITKGYYAPNDGGAGFYNIRVSLSDVEDGGSIIFLDNGNVAELITDGTVNVKQFGAYGDGTHDDTDAIQTAINSVIPNRNTVIPKIVFPSGTYKITDTITLQNYTSLYALGLVTFATYIDGVAFTIATSDYISTYLKHRNHVIIDGGDSPILFQNMLDSALNETICIEWGNSSLLSPNEVKRGNDIQLMRNFNVIGYDVCIDVYSKNYYLNTVEFAGLYDCNICVRYNTSNNDSGENCKFNHCVFGGAKTYAFYFNVGGYDVYINNCSFDYNCALFMFTEENSVFINDCHIEGIGYIAHGSPDTPGTNEAFFAKYTKSSLGYRNTLIVNNCFVCKFNNLDSLFKSSYKNFDVYLNEFKLSSAGAYTWVNGTKYIADDNVNVNDYIPVINYYATLIPQNKKNIKANPFFENISEQTLVSSPRPNLDGSYIWRAAVGIDNMTLSITTEKQYDGAGKSMKMVCTQGAYTEFFTESHACRGGDLILVTCFIYFVSSSLVDPTRKPKGSVYAKVLFYDEDDNLISDDAAYLSHGEHFNNATEFDKWIRLYQCDMAYAPMDAVKYEIKWSVNPTEEQTFYLTGFYTTNIGMMH